MILESLPDYWQWGLITVVIFVLLSIASGKIDVLGGLVGGIIALMIFLGGGFYLMGFLFIFFFLGSFASSWKMKKKQKLGLAEKNKGKRSVANALANGGVGALTAFLAWVFPEHSMLFQAMCVASFASATSDTLSSEFGNIYGQRFINILTFKKDERGKDGVISLEGSLFGVVGSLIIALFYLLIFQSGLFIFTLIFISGLIGNLTDSVLGATLQQKGLLNNHSVNFFNTLVAVVFCMALF